MKKMSIIALLLIAVVVTGSSVSGTYAKYTSTFEGTTDSAKVAKWAFSINDTDVTTASNEFTFDLFNTVNDETTGENDLNVKDDADVAIIAPGTKGEFGINLVNKSEVNAKYSVVYEVVNTANIPVEFSVDGGNTWTTSLANVAATDIVMNANESEDEIVIQWRWTYDSEDRTAVTNTNDEYDTELGENGEYKISVKADITVTQAD